MKAGFGCGIWLNLYNLFPKLPLGKSKSWPSLNWFRLEHTAESLFLVVGKRRGFGENKNLFLQKRDAVAWKCFLEQGSATGERSVISWETFSRQDLDNIFIPLCWMTERCDYLQLFLLLHIASPQFLPYSKTGCLYLSQAGLDPAIEMRKWRMFPGREAPQRKELALTPGTVGSWIFCLSPDKH